MMPIQIARMRRALVSNDNAFKAALLALSPSIYLRLNETSGTTAVNSASGANGTYLGSYTLGSTVLYTTGGTSVLYADEYARTQYPGASVPSLSSGMTIGVIARLVDVSNLHMLINRDGGGGGGNRFWQFRVNGANLEFIQILGSVVTVSFAHGKSAATSALFIARYNPSTGLLALSVNGTVIGSTALDTGLNFGGSDATGLCVGNYFGGSFAAAITGDRYSEAFLIPSVITDAQVSSLASAAGL